MVPLTDWPGICIDGFNLHCHEAFHVSTERRSFGQVPPLVVPLNKRLSTTHFCWRKRSVVKKLAIKKF